MRNRFCPICNAETYFPEDCTHSDYINLSLELDFLGIPFDLEPYAPAREPDPPPPPYIPDRISTRNIILTPPLPTKSVPMFLRL